MIEFMWKECGYLVVGFLQFRANVKANVLSPQNQILAFAYGYRANYPIENDIRLKRRDVHDSMEEIFDQ